MKNFLNQKINISHLLYRQWEKRMSLYIQECLKNLRVERGRKKNRK